MAHNALKAYVNGDVLDINKAKISIFDRGFLYGDGIFETIRTYNGKPFLIDEHIDRLFRSSSLIRMKLPWKYGFLKEAIHKTLSANELKDDCLIRMTVSRGSLQADMVPDKDIKPTLVISLRTVKERKEKDYTRGWRAIISKVVRNSPLSIDPSAKTINFLNNILAKMEAADKGADEAIMLNHQGMVTEGSISNVFVVQGSTVVTPPESDGLLPGITRNFVMKIAATAGLKMREKSLASSDLINADEIFLTVTSAGIMPVTRVEKLMVGSGREGPVTNRLRRLMIELTSV